MNCRNATSTSSILEVWQTISSDTPHYENRQAGEANVPFEIPSSWEWTTVKKVFNDIFWFFYRLSLLRQTQDLLFFTTQSQTFIKACPIFTFQLTYAPVLSLTFNLVEMTFFLILDTHKHQTMRAKESERLFILRFPIQRFGNLTIVLRRIGYTLYSFCAVNWVNSVYRIWIYYIKTPT